VVQAVKYREVNSKSFSSQLFRTSTAGFSINESSEAGLGRIENQVGALEGRFLRVLGVVERESAARPKRKDRLKGEIGSAMVGFGSVRFIWSRRRSSGREDGPSHQPTLYE